MSIRRLSNSIRRIASRPSARPCLWWGPRLLAAQVGNSATDRKPDGRGGFAPIARCYMHLGMREDALQTLEKGYQMRDSRLMLWVPAYEEFDPLRSDPRFQKILHGLGIS